MYARNWQEMSISHELEDTKSTTLVVVSWNLGSPSVNINSNFTSEVSYKEDALLLTIHSKEVDCSYLGKYTCRLALPGQNYQNTTSVKGTLIEIKLQYQTAVYYKVDMNPWNIHWSFFLLSNMSYQSQIIDVFALYKTFTSA